MDEKKKRNESVYIHCKAGKGRSALVTSCYLVKVRHIHGGYSLYGYCVYGVLKSFCDFSMLINVDSVVPSQISGVEL